ncbi:MAG: SUMF1/EgtB/PvdO family nonheme iron enzyme [Phaeodactylibacter sp.]|uniref:formylglycine-generating enzyme family protein n=1 Tax=Phaeodactylibacter sp. TaxID=1940289 RepID=UPI0032EBD202
MDFIKQIVPIAIIMLMGITSPALAQDVRSAEQEKSEQLVRDFYAQLSNFLKEDEEAILEKYRNELESQVENKLMNDLDRGSEYLTIQQYLDKIEQLRSIGVDTLELEKDAVKAGNSKVGEQGAYCEVVVARRLAVEDPQFQKRYLKIVVLHEQRSILSSMLISKEAFEAFFKEPAFQINHLPEMVPLKGGECLIGCTDKQVKHCEEDEDRRLVTLSPFEIGKYEVTNEEYCEFLNDPEVREWEGFPWISIRASRIDNVQGRFTPMPQGERFPVTAVSYHGAESYAFWLAERTGEAFRLPSEEEWEFAARSEGNDDLIYAGSDQYADVAHCRDSKGRIFNRSVIQVGQKAPNSLGVFDMSGNVWEWVSGTDGEEATLRGGGWKEVPENCRVSNKGYAPKSFRRDYNGFRVAKSVKP